MNTIVRLSSSISKTGDFRVFASLKNKRSNNDSLNRGIKLFLFDNGAIKTTTNDTKGSISLATFPSLSLPKTTTIPVYFFLKQANISSIFQPKDSVRRCLSRSSRSDSRLDSEKTLVKDEGEDDEDEDDNDEEKVTSEKSDTTRKRSKDHEGWNRSLQELILYKEKHGDCNVSMKLPGSHRKLGEWVDRQRQQYRLLLEGRKSNMTDDRVGALESIGFVWNIYDQRWEVGYNELMKYKKKFGNCTVPNVPEYEKLFNWVFKQKRLYSRRKRGESSPITDERIKKLEMMGFIWDLQEETWTMRYNELLSYKTNNGDTAVPKHYSSNKHLGMWCEVQRNQMKLRLRGKHSNMTEERIQLLDMAEFIWDVRDYRWNLKFEELAEFYRVNGHHKIPSKTKSGASLAKWTRRQRVEYQKMLDGKKSIISGSRLKLLESINFCQEF